MSLIPFFLTSGTFFSYIFILIKAIVWPKPVDHPYIIKLETVIDGCVFCLPFLSFEDVIKLKIRTLNVYL